jgi:hypothetical protein
MPRSAKWLTVACTLSAALVLTGCGGSRDGKGTTPSGDTGSNGNSNHVEGNIMLSSSAFKPGSPIPTQFTGEGDDLSPPLAWSEAPAGVQSWAIICDDPDAPSPKKPAAEPWVHWVIYNIPSDARLLDAGVPRDAELSEPEGARQGKNSWPSDNVGYRGPMPPPGSGTHRYFFRIYALDSVLDLPPDRADKKSLLAAMKGHILDQGQLKGTYERK